jgi:hypothetical protein
MTATVRDILAAFDALSPPEQQLVAAEILRRSANSDGLSEAALDELAVELFRSYDTEEALEPPPVEIPALRQLLTEKSILDGAGNTSAE